MQERTGSEAPLSETEIDHGVSHLRAAPAYILRRRAIGEPARRLVETTSFVVTIAPATIAVSMVISTITVPVPVPVAVATPSTIPLFSISLLWAWFAIVGKTNVCVHSNWIINIFKSFLTLIITRRKKREWPDDPIQGPLKWRERCAPNRKPPMERPCSPLRAATAASGVSY